MFKSDAAIFDRDFLKLSVISIEGNVWSVDAAPDFTVEKLKTMALRHFYNPLNAEKITANYKLVLVSGKRQLGNENTIIQEGLKNNEELLLLERRNPPSKDNLTDESLRSPTEAEINAATKDIVQKNVFKLHPMNECSADFQSEIRKILISLVEASARILTPSPSVEEVFQLIRDRLDSKGLLQPDPKAIQQLVDMGFTEDVATEAVRVTRDQKEALEWMREHGHKARNVREDTTNAAAASTSTKTKGPNKRSVTQTVASLLESFRALKRQDFRPNHRALQQLLEMGFEEEEAMDALRITGNNKASACEWLLGDRRASLEDLGTGLDPESPIYKAIMNNPAIQLSLTSPKMFYAYFSMLEDPESAKVWINDPDASPVLSQIFKTYHSEKYAIQMNRYVEQQKRSKEIVDQRSRQQQSRQH